MEKISRTNLGSGAKTRANLGLVIQGFYEDIDELKRLITEFGGNIVYTESAPHWVKLWIKRDESGGRDR